MWEGGLERCLSAIRCVCCRGCEQRRAWGKQRVFDFLSGPIISLRHFYMLQSTEKKYKNRFEEREERVLSLFFYDLRLRSSTWFSYPNMVHHAWPAFFGLRTAYSGGRFLRGLCVCGVSPFSVRFSKILPYAECVSNVRCLKNNRVLSTHHSVS